MVGKLFQTPPSPPIQVHDNPLFDTLGSPPSFATLPPPFAIHPYHLQSHLIFPTPKLLCPMPKPKCRTSCLLASHN